MGIDKIGGLNPLDNTQGERKTSAFSQTKRSSDSIAVSDEAREMAAVYYAKQVAAETPDVRADRVAEVKAKLQDPNYLNDAVISSTADNIMASFGL